MAGTDPRLLPPPRPKTQKQVSDEAEITRLTDAILSRLTERAVIVLVWTLGAIALVGLVYEASKGIAK